MFTKAHPNSLWQGTAEKIAASCAAKFRRVKKVLLYLQWMWLMLGRPRESGWFSLWIFFLFQGKGWSRFFFRIHFVVKLRKMHTICGELAISICSGKGCVSQLTIYKCMLVYSGGHNAAYRLILHCICITADFRGQTEWIKVRINSECI